MKLQQIVLVLVLSWPINCLADFAAGLDAYNAAVYATALREWRALAKQ